MGREWRVQRIGRAMLTGILLLALAGVFGTGPLSWSSASTADGSLTAEYARFARRGGPITLRLHVAESAVVDGRVRVVLSHELLETLEVRHITPDPVAQVSTDAGVVLAFELEGDVALEASINATADAMGVHQGTVGLEGEAPLELWQLFYP